LNNWCIWIIL